MCTFTLQGGMTGLWLESLFILSVSFRTNNPWSLFGKCYLIIFHRWGSFTCFGGSSIVIDFPVNSSHFIIIKLHILHTHTHTHKRFSLLVQKTQKLNSSASAVLLQYCIQPQDGTNTYQIQICYIHIYMHK